MIQRPQSILLFLAAILMLVGGAFFPILSFETATGCTQELNSFNYIKCDNGVITTSFTSYIFMIQVVFSLVCIYSIISFKKRKLQMTLGGINSLLGCACLVIIVLLTRNQEIASGYKLGFYFPIVAVLCNIIANKLIRKDEKAVKSLDRIR
ncbi:MAG: DUF4293 domain-containing protein [Cyclobacteriaceae bacterium]